MSDFIDSLLIVLIGLVVSSLTIKSTLAKIVTGTVLFVILHKYVTVPIVSLIDTTQRKSGKFATEMTIYLIIINLFMVGIHVLGVEVWPTVLLFSVFSSCLMPNSESTKFERKSFDRLRFAADVLREYSKFAAHKYRAFMLAPSRDESWRMEKGFFKRYAARASSARQYNAEDRRHRTAMRNLNHELFIGSSYTVMKLTVSGVILSLVSGLIFVPISIALFDLNTVSAWLLVPQNIGTSSACNAVFGMTIVSVMAWRSCDMYSRGIMPEIRSSIARDEAARLFFRKRHANMKYLIYFFATLVPTTIGIGILIGRYFGHFR
jgi:hypothetical protein